MALEGTSDAGLFELLLCVVRRLAWRLFNLVTVAFQWMNPHQAKDVTACNLSRVNSHPSVSTCNAARDPRAPRLQIK